MRVGAELKAARKKAGLTVEVISKRTKIAVSKLVALEKNDFKNLPTGLYLFSAVRAYAREVQIDPEPIVERLRAEFAEKDALDALQALDKTGALDARNLGDGKKSKDEQSHLLRNAAIAAGVVMIAAAGAGARAFFHDTPRPAQEAPPTSPAPAATVATAIVPQQVVDAAQVSAPAKTQRPKARPAVVPEAQEPAVAVGAVSEEPADTPANLEEPRPEEPSAETVP